jgi:cyclophilin family peptidyl-prolyl cis-trans isomerase
VEISTSMGSMKFRLYDDTPKHRDAFIELASEGYSSFRAVQKVRKMHLPESVSVTEIRTKRLMMKFFRTTFIKKVHCVLPGNPTR